MRPKKTFHKFCIKCEKKFHPSSKYSRLCTECQKEAIRNNKRNVKDESNESIAFQELQLNIEHQKIDNKKFYLVGYEFEPGCVVMTIMLPFNLKKILKGGEVKCSE